jgi:hypothetical protein
MRDICGLFCFLTVISGIITWILLLCKVFCTNFSLRLLSSELPGRLTVPPSLHRLTSTSYSRARMVEYPGSGPH